MTDNSSRAQVGSSQGRTEELNRCSNHNNCDPNRSNDSPDSSENMESLESLDGCPALTKSGESRRSDGSISIDARSSLRSSDDSIQESHTRSTISSISSTVNTDQESESHKLKQSGENILNVITEFDFAQAAQNDKRVAIQNLTNLTESDESDGSVDPNVFDDLSKSQDSDSCPDFTQIDHTAVKYNRNFIRSRGALGQIIRSIADMKVRSQRPEPNNAYQVHLYPIISVMCDKIVDRYLNLISKIPHSDYIVFGSYLNGTNNDGQMKETTIRHEKKAYRYSQMKETLKSVKDRLKHILANSKRCSKDITRTKENRKIFKRVINFCLQFSSDVEGYIANWEHEVKTCREICKVQNKPESSRPSVAEESNLIQIKSGPNSGIKRLVI
jgi:hypothetical protein